MQASRTTMVVTGSHKQWPAHLLAITQIDRTGARRVWSLFWSASTDILVDERGPHAYHIGQHICWPLHRLIGRERVAFGLSSGRHLPTFWWASTRPPPHHRLIGLTSAAFGLFVSSAPTDNFGGRVHVYHSWHRTQFLDTLIFLADGTSASGWQQHQHYRHHYRNNSEQRWRNNVGTTRVLNLQPTTPTPAWLRQPDSRAPLQPDTVPQRCNTLRTQHHQDFQLEATSPTGTAGFYKHRSCHFTPLYHPKHFITLFS